MTETYNETDGQEIIDENESAKKRDKTFKTFKKFLKADMKIKEELIKMAPSLEDDYDEETRIEYTDKLDSLLKDFRVELELISEGFEFGDAVSSAISNFVQHARKNLVLGRYDAGIGKNLYQQNFSNMNPQFIEEVKNRCIGYTGANPLL